MKKATINIITFIYGGTIKMINYIEHNEGINILSQLLLEERLIPIFGAGFSKSSPSANGFVPDGEECTELMKTLIKKYVTGIDDTVLASYNFNDTAKRFKKSVPHFIPESKYLEFFKNNFTEVKLSQIKENFLRLPWPFAFTINIDDGIENTNLFNSILPYQNARKNYSNNKHSLFKLHGDAKYELQYKQENNIIFDSDQYTQSLNNSNNQTMRECFSNAYKEFNLLFIGCSLTNEPDIKFIYNSIVKERLNTMGIILRTQKLSQFEEDDLEDYGVTDVILVKDYDLFYTEFTNAIYNVQAVEKANNYPFINPTIKTVENNNLKYFCGFRCFSEQENTFYKSHLIIDRDYLFELENSLKSFNMVFIEGRRFSGKTYLLCSLCAREKRRKIYFFPSTTQESPDMIFDIIHHQQNSMLVFDSNSLSSECYYMLQDITDTLQNNNNKVVIALNQSDTYLPELTKSDYIKINNTFSDGELSLLTPETNLHGFTERRTRNSNLDYLNILKKEQSIPISLDLKLPNEYTNNEQIILLLLGTKDKIYSRELNSLQIKYSEIQSFLSRVSILCEWIHTTKGESGTYSTYKLVHNSKNIILDEIGKIEHDSIIRSILSIVKAFKDGDNNQKRIYREVMQFDTLNQLFGRKKGAGKLIFSVYQNLESELSNDLHFWLQRSKSIYRLMPNNYWKLKSAYSYAKKVYLDSDNDTLITKAALSVSLICSLIYKLERNYAAKLNVLEESIDLGYQAIFSEYYTQEKRLENDLNTENLHNNYADLMKESCSTYTLSIHKNSGITKKATSILNKLK